MAETVAAIDCNTLVITVSMAHNSCKPRRRLRGILGLAAYLKKVSFLRRFGTFRLRYRASKRWPCLNSMKVVLAFSRSQTNILQWYPAFYNTAI